MSSFERVPLRHLARILGGGTPSTSPTYWGGNIPFVTPKDLRAVDGTTVQHTERSLTTEGAQNGSRIAPANSVILSIRAPIGYCALLKTESAFSQGCKALIPNEERIQQKFLMYSLSGVREVLNSRANGTTFFELSSESLSSVTIEVPSLRLQDRIVEFLDAELGRIDTLQTGLQRLADLVEERRLARLTSSFSSFDAAEKLKLKWILKKRSDEATPGSGTVTAFRDGQVTLRELRREDGYTFSETEDGYQSVHEGDLVFHGLDGFAGAIGIAEKDGNCSPVYHVCSLRNPDYDLTFIAEYLRYLGLAGYLATEAPNVRQRSVDFRNWDRFANLLLPFPRLEEQRRIIASLSADLEQDESFVQQVTQMQDLLKERRSALITAAVTGELEV